MKCFHCEAAPALTGGVLCGSCNQSRAIRRTYKRAGRNPAWDAWILQLATRARLELPLFGDGEETPARPRRSTAQPSRFG